MPVDFLSPQQAARYGQYNQEPSALQRTRYFHLDDTDRKHLRRYRQPHTRLVGALQLCTVRFMGTFLPDPTRVPALTVRYVADQMDIDDLSCLKRFRLGSRAHYEQTRHLQEAYGYREFAQVGFALTRWLYQRAWMTFERPSTLFDLATAWLVERKILLPGVSTLTRLIARIRDRVATRLWNRLVQLPTPAQRERLEGLLAIAPGQRQTTMERLRQGPAQVSGSALVKAFHRLEEIRALDVGSIPLTGIPAGRLKALARQAAATWAPQLARMAEPQRIARLLAFARHYETLALDDALDLFDSLMTLLQNRARASGKKARLRSLRDIDASALVLADLARVLLDDGVEDEGVRTRAFTRVSRRRAQIAVETITRLTRAPEDDFQQERLQRYQTLRRFLPQMLRLVSLQATQSGKPLLAAWRFLKEREERGSWESSGAPLEFLPPAWKKRVVRYAGSKPQVDRRAYTLCVLEQLQEALRRRDIFALGSERWGDPRAKLLSGSAWEQARAPICRVLEKPAEPAEELERLAQGLEDSYRQVQTRLPTNAALALGESGQLVLSPLDRVPEPLSLVSLRQKTRSLLPRVDLPELLLEMNLRTGFARAFDHQSERGGRVADLELSLCAVLVAQACNVGLEPLVQAHPALSHDRLEWVSHHFLHAQSIAAANAKLVEAQNDIALAQTWGGGEVASADGLRFVVPVRTAHAGHNRKYFGAARGITYYNFTSDQFTGLHGIVIPGTTHEAPYLLEGLLEQQSLLRPLEMMADTAAYSDVIFGLFHLLGYQFSPRLADIGAARLWRIDPTADYGALNPLSKNRVQTERIERNWDDLLRIAGSLKMGTISASELVRSLLRAKRPSGAVRALVELGRLCKTLYLLRYLDDEAYRRRILVQLNRHESRHALAREVMHGRRGEIRQRYREGQEDQLGALGLVLNVIVLWNTLYMDAALAHLRRRGQSVLPADVARLSPLGSEHINLLGRYSFELPAGVRNGKLRPLRRQPPETTPGAEPAGQDP
jgi:TnpA family transposase